MRLLALLLAFGLAHAKGYPTKPVRVIVPVAAGGNQEITIRAVADEMSKTLGQPPLIEAKPSASALVGTQFVARSARLTRSKPEERVARPRGLRSAWRRDDRGA